MEENTDLTIDIDDEFPLLNKILNFGKPQKELAVPKLSRITFLSWELWLVLVIIGIILELTFRFTNELYMNRPVNIFFSIGGILFIGFCGLLVSITYPRFYKQLAKIIKKNNILYQKDQPLETVFQNPKLSLRKKTRFLIKTGLIQMTKFSHIINLFLHAVISILTIIMIFATIISYNIQGVGLLFPAIPISFVMLNYQAITFTLFTAILYMTIFIPFFFAIIIVGVILRVDVKKLRIYPSKKNHFIVFTNIGKLIAKVSFTILITALIFEVITAIETILGLYIIRSATPLYMVNQLFSVSLTVRIIASLTPLIYFLIVFLTPQYFILRKIKYYKINKLKPLEERKLELMNKILSGDIEETNRKKNLEELSEIDYIRDQVYSVNNWVFNYKTYVSIFISSLLPIIITIVSKILDIYVF